MPFEPSTMNIFTCFDLGYEFTRNKFNSMMILAKLKHVTVIVTCTYYVVIGSRTCRRCEISKKLTLNPSLTAKNTTFSFPIHGAIGSNICLKDAPTCPCIQPYT